MGVGRSGWAGGGSGWLAVAWDSEKRAESEKRVESRE